MTLKDFYAIAEYHRREAKKCADAILSFEAQDAEKNALLIMHTRDRLLFHQQSTAQLTGMAKAFEALAPLFN